MDTPSPSRRPSSARTSNIPTLTSRPSTSSGIRTHPPTGLKIEPKISTTPGSMTMKEAAEKIKNTTRERYRSFAVRKGVSAPSTVPSKQPAAPPSEPKVEKKAEKDARKRLEEEAGQSHKKKEKSNGDTEGMKDFKLEVTVAEVKVIDSKEEAKASQVKVEEDKGQGQVEEQEEKVKEEEEKEEVEAPKEDEKPEADPKEEEEADANGNDVNANPKSTVNSQHSKLEVVKVKDVKVSVVAEEGEVKVKPEEVKVVLVQIEDTPLGKEVEKTPTFSSFSLPCRHKHSGCTETFPPSDIQALEKHNKDCDFRPVPCFWCNRVLAHYDFLVHLHSHFILPIRRCGFTTKLFLIAEHLQPSSKDKFLPKWLHCFGQDFFLIVTKDAGKWNAFVTTLANSKKAREFYAEITILNGDLKKGPKRYTVQSLRTKKDEVYASRSALTWTNGECRFLAGMTDQSVIGAFIIDVEIRPKPATLEEPQSTGEYHLPRQSWTIKPTKNANANSA